MLEKNKIIQKSKKHLLDSSAIIALLRKEPGHEILEGLIANSAISTVNLCEIVTVLTRNKILEEEIDEIIDDLVPDIIPLSKEISIIAGKLTIYTNKYGLSLGDRVCIATGILLDIPIYTTDKVWKECNIHNANIVLIR